MYCSKTANNLINKIHKRSLRVIYEMEDANFEELPAPANYVKHIRCLFLKSTLILYFLLKLVFISYFTVTIC